jgi:hypothetical protein
VGVDVTFKRLAVTPEQIEEMGLPSAPPKKTDQRTFNGKTTTQCEAIPPGKLGEILESALASLWNRAVYESGLAEFKADL